MIKIGKIEPIELTFSLYQEESTPKTSLPSDLCFVVLLLVFQMSISIVR